MRLSSLNLQAQLLGNMAWPAQGILHLSLLLHQDCIYLALVVLQLCVQR